MTHYSLYDLNEHIRRVLALNFQQPVWITAEIAQLGQSRGHLYLDLVQKGEGDELIAQAQAVLWAGDLRKMRARLASDLDAVLREGQEVKMQITVDFHERYGLKLVIADLDPAYTFGQLELKRRQTIETLRGLDLLERNRRQPLPKVLQRIAVISSENAAGFRDFQEHLTQNAFGYGFSCRLFASSVQGKNAEAELLEALQTIDTTRFDCIVIVRGGGARLDLSAFDGLELCKRVAQMPLPVFTGIGHDVDETVLDLVAHAALKTPTAVADFLLQHNLSFENELLQLAARLRSAGDQQLKISQLELQQAEQALRWNAGAQLRASFERVDRIAETLPQIVRARLRGQAQKLEAAEAVCLALHPENVLKRGYSMTYKDGKPLMDASEVASGDLLETVLLKGTVLSKSVGRKRNAARDPRDGKDDRS
ncbi:MAG: exodeoxyribonuclease VII large subunit [Lewinellaceae bacterium]|nr:exodeoxyribonuclease VII large subunit [Lewinellaceae bacterium]